MAAPDTAGSGDLSRSRRTLLRGGVTAGLGLSTLVLPTAASASSTVFTTGIRDDGLVMYLDAAVESSWNGSGNWNDLTGNNLWLPTGGVMSPSKAEWLGITGDTGAFVFDGTAGVIPNPAATMPAFAYGQAWTVAVWVRHESLDGWQTYVGHGDRGGNALYFQKAFDDLDEESTASEIGTTRSTNRQGAAFGGRGDLGDLYCYAPGEADTTTWYHLVLTADANRVVLHRRFLVGGVVTADVTTVDTKGTGGSLKPRAPTDGPVTTVIGNRFDNIGDPFDGALAFLQIWTRALTEEEVAAQYAATRAPYHPLT